MATFTPCNTCGKRASKHYPICKSCDKARREKRYAEAAAIVKANKCPYCGSGMRRNLALTGWWQCEQYGAEGFRKDDSRPSCSFQTTTEH